MSNLQQHNQNDLMDMLHEIREAQQATAVSVGKIETSLDNLAGPYGRVTSLEKTNSRQWWLTIAIAPALALGHALARKFQIDI